MDKSTSAEKTIRGLSRLAMIGALLFFAAQFYSAASDARDEALCPHGCGVCRKDWAHCPCPEGQVHNYQSGKCVDSCKQKNGCHAQVEVDRLVKEGEFTLKAVAQKTQTVQSDWRQCTGPADTLWNACKSAYQPTYDACIQKKSRSACDNDRYSYCADTPPSEQKCKNQIAAYNKLNYQRME